MIYFMIWHMHFLFKYHYIRMHQRRKLFYQFKETLVF